MRLSFSRNPTRNDAQDCIRVNHRGTRLGGGDRTREGRLPLRKGKCRLVHKAPTQGPQVILSSQKVKSVKLKESDFSFKNIDDALKDLSKIT